MLQSLSSETLLQGHLQSYSLNEPQPTSAYILHSDSPVILRLLKKVVLIISRWEEVGGEDCQGSKNASEVTHNNQQGIIMLPLKKLYWLVY